MINGPLIGGFLIALTLVVGTLYVGTWFHSAVSFADARSLDAARSSRPIICWFKNDEEGGQKGSIHVRDGLMRFEIQSIEDNVISEWGVEIDMNDTFIMARGASGDPYVSVEGYPNLRVQIIEDLKRIVSSERMYCSPWWSGSSQRFSIESADRN